MSTALEAARRHLSDLAANRVPGKEKPSALHHGLIKQLAVDLEELIQRSQIAEFEAQQKFEALRNRLPDPEPYYPQDEVQSLIEDLRSILADEDVGA